MQVNEEDENVITNNIQEICMTQFPIWITTWEYVYMANLATKPSSRDGGLVAILAISTNMLHEPDISEAISGTIVCPRTWGNNSQGMSQHGSNFPWYRLHQYLTVNATSGS